VLHGVAEYDRIMKSGQVNKASYYRTKYESIPSTSPYLITWKYALLFFICIRHSTATESFIY
jgi:hypothetical protein